MRYEAKHQGVKRKCKAMGYRNIIETVPKLMNETRCSEIKKLISQSEQKVFTKGSYFYGRIAGQSSIFKIVSARERTLNISKIDAEFNTKLLSYKVIKENDGFNVTYDNIIVISCGMFTTYVGQDFVFFYDYLE